MGHASLYNRPGAQHLDPLAPHIPAHNPNLHIAPEQNKCFYTLCRFDAMRELAALYREIMRMMDTAANWPEWPGSEAAAAAITAAAAEGQLVGNLPCTIVQHEMERVAAFQSKLQSAYDAWARNEPSYTQRFAREQGLPWDKALLEEVKVRDG